MTSPMPGAHPHPRIKGESGELIELFMALIDRAPAEDPAWWHNYGAMAGVHVGIALRPEAGRTFIMFALRDAMERIVAAGLSEAFLIRALKTDLDDYVERIGDTAGYDARIEEMREHFLEVIEDPAVRARWRQVRGEQDPAWLTKSDDEIIADAREGHERFGKKLTTADGAAERWASVAAWREISSELLPNPIFAHWTNLNIRREMEGPSV